MPQKKTDVPSDEELMARYDRMKEPVPTDAELSARFEKLNQERASSAPSRLDAKPNALIRPQDRIVRDVVQEVQLDRLSAQMALIDYKKNMKSQTDQAVSGILERAKSGRMLPSEVGDKIKLYELRLKVLQNGQVYDQKHPPTSDFGRKQQAEDVVRIESLKRLIQAYEGASSILKQNKNENLSQTPKR